MMIYVQRGLELVVRAEKLQGRAWRVVRYLEMVAGRNNEVPMASEIAPVLGMQRSHTSRAYGELVEAGFLLKRGLRYYLSPDYCWHGTASDKVAAINVIYGKELTAAEARALPYPEQEDK